MRPPLLGPRGTALAVAAMTALSLLLGLRTIGRDSFWDDEAFTAAAARLPLADLFTLSTERDPHTALYHFMQHFWTAAGGDGEAWMRLLSVLFGAAAVPVLWLVVRRLFGVPEAFVASLLMSVSVFLVQYQQEARPYTLALLLSVLSMYWFVRAVQDGGVRSWLAWGLFAGLAAYGHPFALGVAGGQLLSLVFLPGVRSSWRKIALGTALLVAVVVPFVITVALMPGHENLAWVLPPTVSSVAGAAYLVTGHIGYGQSLLIAGLVGWLSWMTLRFLRSDGRSQRVWSHVLVLGWILVLPIGMLLASIAEPVFVPRYLIPCLPGVMVAAAVAGLRYVDRYAGAVALAIVVLTAPVGLAEYYRSDKDDWRLATEFVMNNAQPGDGVIFELDHRVPFEYYFLRNGGEELDAPRPISPIRPWGSDLPPYEDRAPLSTPELVADVVQPFQRVWWLGIDEDPMNEVLAEGLFNVFGPPAGEEFEPRVFVRLYSVTPDAG